MQLVEPRPSRPVLIRITPLIDVVFILLVFFMLTTRLLPVGGIEVASAAAGQGAATGEAPPLLHLTDSGTIEWNGEARTKEAVLALLDRLRPERVVVTTAPATTLTRFTQWQGYLAERGIAGQWRRQGDDSAGATP